MTLTLKPASHAAIRMAVILEADERHAQYPQYAGHWDGVEWQPVVFTRNVRTKGGLAFEKGDVTIARPPAYRDEHDHYPVAYSRRNHIDTAVHLGDFDWIASSGDGLPRPLQTWLVTIPFSLEVIALSADEARQLMRDHLADFPPDWLHHRALDDDVTAVVVDDCGNAINEGRYEDEAENADVDEDG
jgi:hypothetical protein